VLRIVACEARQIRGYTCGQDRGALTKPVKRNAQAFTMRLGLFIIAGSKSPIAGSKGPAIQARIPI
jgi:hypothetical protein